MIKRSIDASTHNLSGPQILEQVLRMFRDDKVEPIVLFTAQGQGDNTVRFLRAELSRLKKAKKATGVHMANFGFTVTGPIEVRIDNMNKEGYALQFQMTPLQLMRNFAHKSEIEF